MTHMLSVRLFSAAVCAWLVTSCTGEYVVLEPEGAAGADAGGGSGGDATASRAMFEADVEPLLVKARPKGACIGCHQGADPGNGPDFLGPDAGSHFETLRTNVRLVGASPEVSLLYTQPDHTGNTWCRGANNPYAGCTADETVAIRDWIDLEKGN